jgi:glycogen operon protein
VSPSGLKDISWIDASGREMVDADWHDSTRRSLAALFGGDTGDRFVSMRGYPEYDDTFLMLLNAHEHEIPFTLPTLPTFVGWRLVIDTTQPQRLAPDSRFLPGAIFPLRARTLALLAAE